VNAPVSVPDIAHRFVMGSINTRAVRRSNALQDHAYGSRFRYREVFGESSLSLALDYEALPSRAGVLTPAIALGRTLVERLRVAGQTYEVERTA
jgi:short subunit dehydrogenase-like uncharacterized protein